MLRHVRCSTCAYAMSLTPVEQIKQRLSILDVVGPYVSLQKAGKSFKGKSPFTQEKTPSFFVSPERGMYYCFSTGKGGDMFTFVQEMEGVDFRGALKILAERAGVELVPVNAAVRDERDKLYGLMAEAARYFFEELRKNQEVLAYLEQRGVRTETVQRWQIGYAPRGWRNLKEHLVEVGYPEHLIQKAGLIKNSGQSEGSYDVFRERVMFPIADVSGRVVGFSGRTLSTDPNTPKYVNSPETELYQKSHVLFGYDKARHGIRTYDFSLVVEGQFDLVLSHQAGYTNTVALSGTALSEAHVEQLSRLSHRVVLALDADRAGINSVKRSADLLLRRGMDVKVARMHGGKDPADLVRDNPQQLKAAVGGAMHVIEFLLAVLKEGAKDERAYRLRVREEVLPFISLMPNRIDQEHFEDIVARELSVTKDAIHFEVSRLRSESDAMPSQGEEPHRDVGMKEGRLEELTDYLFGTLLLWESGEGGREAEAVALRGHLEFMLGHDSMRALRERPSLRQNEAIFRAERAWAEGQISSGTAALLHELYTLILRRRLGGSRDRLRTAERAADQNAIHEELQAAHDINEALKQLIHENPFLDK